MTRIQREKTTIDCMIALYCTAKHGAGDPLCSECASLLEYATARLDRCPHGNLKPACRECAIHCYKPEMREIIRKIMRFAGPRLMFRHPILSIMHILDSMHVRRTST